MNGLSLNNIWFENKKLISMITHTIATFLISENINLFLKDEKKIFRL